MKNAFYYLSFICFSILILGCGSDKKKEEKTGAPIDGEIIDLDAPIEVFYELVHKRLEVTMEQVGMTEDTSAASISGYIDSRNAPVPVNEMQLILQTRYQNEGKEVETTDTLNIEKDGRVPGLWVAEGAQCYFTLMAQDTFRFNTAVNKALYRLKMRFKAKV